MAVLDEIRMLRDVIQAGYLTPLEMRAATAKLAGLSALGWAAVPRKPGSLRPLTWEVAHDWAVPHSAAFLMEHSRGFDAVVHGEQRKQP
jgi:hypothetical protein